MSRWMIILLAVLALPYGYLAVYWTVAVTTQGQFTGNMLFLTFIALVALPFLIAIIGGGVMMGGALRLREAAVSGAPTPDKVLRGAGGGLRFWIGLSLLLTALPTAATLLFRMLDTPEEGRDSLGRICETTGSRTTCRPDPAVERPSELDRINAARKRKQWFEKD
jgi:hypothetical protein